MLKYCRHTNVQNIYLKYVKVIRFHILNLKYAVLTFFSIIIDL